MKISHVLERAFLSYVPVAAVLMAWIWMRSDALVAKSAGMDPGFLVPQTTAEAVKIGYTIWLPMALILALFLGFVFYTWAHKLHWNRIGYSASVIGIAAAVSAGAFVSGMAFAVEATGEMMTIAIGYGVLLPVLCRRRPKAELITS